MINFGRDVYEERVENTMLKVIMKFLQRGMTFNDVTEFLTLSKEEEKRYIYLLQEKGVDI